MFPFRLYLEPSSGRLCFRFGSTLSHHRVAGIRRRRETNQLLDGYTSRGPDDNRGVQAVLCACLVDGPEKPGVP